MSAKTESDLIVIGAGSGGLAAAKRAAALGAQVTLVEAGRVGGTCVLRGCIPKKFMIYARGCADAFALAPHYGFRGASPTLDWGQLIAAQQALLDRLEQSHRGHLERAGVRLVAGRAQVTGPHTVQVPGQPPLTGRHILLACGGRPRALPGPGGARAINSDDFFQLPKQPQRALLIGGGYIGVELASLLQGLGTQVTLAVRGHLLNGFDRDLSAAILIALRHQGIDVRLQCALGGLVADGEATQAELSAHAEGGAERLRVDCVLAAVGRQANGAGLLAPELGLALGPNDTLQVDPHHRTAVPSIWAIGDLIGRLDLTPMAIRAGRHVAEALFYQPGPPLSYADVPRAIFAEPPAASVGLSEAEAEARGTGAVRCFSTRFSPLRYAPCPAAERRSCWMKVVVDAASDRVLGLHMVGEEAPEIMQGFAAALNAGITKAQLDATLPIHPTVAEEFVLMR